MYGMQYPLLRVAPARVGDTPDARYNLPAIELFSQPNT